MKEKIVFTVVIILCSIIAIVSQIRLNYSNLDKVGTINGNYVSVVVENKDDYQLLLNKASEYKLNVLKKDYDLLNNTSIFNQLKYFNAYELTNNPFDNGVVNKLLFEKVKFKKLSNYYTDKTSGRYLVVSDYLNNQQIQKIFKDNNMITNKVDSGVIDDFNKFLNLTLIFVLIAFILYKYIASVLSLKKITILKLYSYPKQAFDYLYKNNLRLFIINFLISFILLYIFLQISFMIIFKHLFFLLFIYLLFILYSIVEIFKKNKIHHLKGRKNLNKIYNLYKIVIFVMFIMISSLFYIILGNPNDDINLLQAKSEWTLEKDYGQLQPSKSVLESGIFQINLNDIYHNTKPLYLDNTSFSRLEYNILNNSKEKENINPRIDVNKAYLDKFNIKVKTTNDITILVPTNIYPKQKNNKELCTYYNNKSEEVTSKSCQFIKYDGEETYINAISNKEGSPYYKDTIIRVFNDDFIKDKLDIDVNSLFFKLDKDKNLEDNFKLLNSKSNNMLLKNNDFKGLDNEYFKNINYIKDANNMKIIITIFISLLYVSVSLVLVMIINLYSNINNKKIFIKKFLGYSLYERYHNLFNFIYFTFLLSSSTVAGFIIYSEVGKLSNSYLVALISIYLLSSILIITNIKYLEQKKLSNILKGEVF